jgi:hypothetical protein
MKLREHEALSGTDLMVGAPLLLAVVELMCLVLG